MALSSRVALLWIVLMSSNLFQFWEHPKVTVSYVGTARRLAKLWNLVFRQKFLHQARRMRWRVIMVEKPVTAWPETRSFPSHGITQSFQNFNVIFFVDRPTSGSKFVVNVDYFFRLWGCCALRNYSKSSDDQQRIVRCSSEKIAWCCEKKTTALLVNGWLASSPW